MGEEIKSLTKEILDKKFKTSVSGYSKKEVDEFLDGILDFMDSLEKSIDENERYTEDLRKNNLELKSIIEQLDLKLKAQPTELTPVMPIDNSKNELLEKKLDFLEQQIIELRKELATN